ncbi:hypothetical protein TrVE_jg14035 [Triparma verrucosa]|uniref:non-specific serine/threonine protein kinase n=2 Tax=Triparma TaxID=722752 RepID=A0A9W7AWV3_9STRA|nr:hypothetical protein TrST_g9201 [Triparma strigata]GMH96737.1 hypothetical protein TrVE_jg14035 [Triparma verrucosa]
MTSCPEPATFSKPLFIIITTLFLIVILLTIYHLHQITQKLLKIRSDPRNKLVSDSNSQAGNVFDRGVGSERADIEFGSRELVDLKERAFNKVPARRLSISFSFRKQADEKEYEWEIHWKEIHLEEKVGEGSFGEVFRGSWLGTTVAVKTMRNASSNALKMDKFLGEIALTSTLHHPNIVLFYGACVEVPNVCLVMEYLAINLYDLLHTRSKSQIHFFVLHRFACDVARGMKYLHRRAKVIQRDLKSRNIMVDNNFNAKICDFGLSRYMKLDQTMTFCGTPYWTAPEIIRQEAYTEKADVYSYGIVLWELITAQEPYSGMESMEVAYAAAERGLRPTIPTVCPEGYAELMQRCWSDNPADRPDFTKVLEILFVMKKSFENLMTPAMMATHRRKSIQDLTAAGQNT